MICLGIFYGKIIWGILLWKWHWTFDFYLDNYHEMGMKEIPIIWDLMGNKLSLFDGTKHFWKTHERKLWMGIKKKPYLNDQTHGETICWFTGWRWLLVSPCSSRKSQLATVDLRILRLSKTPGWSPGWMNWMNWGHNLEVFDSIW